MAESRSLHARHVDVMTDMELQVIVNGHAVELMRFSEKTDGSVIILLRKATRFTHSTAGPAIEERRITVHYSDKIDGLSQINHHFRKKGKTSRITASCFTRTIKCIGNVGLLIGNIYPDLRDSRYLAKKSERQIISIGAFDQDLGHLSLSIFVCHVDLAINSASSQRSTIELYFKRMKLVITYSQIRDWRPTTLGTFSSPVTHPPSKCPEHLYKANEDMMNGLHPAAISEIHRFVSALNMTTLLRGVMAQPGTTVFERIAAQDVIDSMASTRNLANSITLLQMEDLG